MSQQLESSQTIEFNGVAINSGKVVASACLYSAMSHPTVARHELDSEEAVAEDLHRFEEALEKCSDELDRVAERVEESIGKSEAEIFLTQKHILHDPEIVGAITEGVRKRRMNVETVITEVYGSYEERFASLDFAYLRERSSDIGEVKRRLLDRLLNTRPGFVCQGQSHCSRGRNRIVVAKELTAEMMARMNLEHVLGIVTEHGGISSHAAIIARSVGVPSVSGVRNVMKHVNCGSRLLVDGDEGRVFVNPDEDLVAQLIPAEPVLTDRVCHLSSPPGTEVMANASMIDDVRHAMTLKADGIGLFRTEIVFMAANRLLNEDEQYAYYSKVMNQAHDKPVTFRLLDVGGDKPLPFLRIGEESNPYLGWRGARFLLGSPELLRAQVRALARLSPRWPVSVMFPMVVDVAQIRELKKAVLEIMREVEGFASERIKLGAMFEVPSACIQADRILEEVDFGSIGSNDLIQYLFAVDRNNELVSQDYDPSHPVLWEILETLSKAARRRRKPISICGEMASRKGMPARLLDIGIQSLSVSPRLVPRVREEVVAYAERSHQIPDAAAAIPNKP